MNEKIHCGYKSCGCMVVAVLAWWLESIELAEMRKRGLRVETMNLDEYRKKSFGCSHKEVKHTVLHGVCQQPVV